MPIPKKEYLQTIVYQAINTLNGDFYIGVTCKSLKQRAAEHFNHAKGRAYCKYFHAALRKYGENNFKWGVLSTHQDYSEALKNEICLIAAMKPKYNITAGGQGFVGLVRTPEWTEKIANANRGRKLTCEQIEKMRQRGLSGISFKKVICLNDGNVFAGVKLAAIHYGIKPSRISTICHGVEVSTNGLHFRLYTAPISEGERLNLLCSDIDRLDSQYHKLRKKRGKAVLCSNGMKYDSVHHAAQSLELHTMTVSMICNGKQTKTRSGLSFTFANEELMAA